MHLPSTMCPAVPCHALHRLLFHSAPDHASLDLAWPQPARPASPFRTLHCLSVPRRATPAYLIQAQTRHAAQCRACRAVPVRALPTRGRPGLQILTAHDLSRHGLSRPFPPHSAKLEVVRQITTLQRRAKPPLTALCHAKPAVPDHTRPCPTEKCPSAPCIACQSSHFLASPNTTRHFQQCFANPHRTSQRLAPPYSDSQYISCHAMPF